MPARSAAISQSVHRYNLKTDLSAHANPQRPSYACGKEGGLLLCTWPKGGALSLPFVYSNEVWTGIEYQVASHLMLLGTGEGRPGDRAHLPRPLRRPGAQSVQRIRMRPLVRPGDVILRAAAGLTGARYDAVDKVLHLEPRIAGDFRSFLATATGFGTVGVRGGKPFLDVKSGHHRRRRSTIVPLDRECSACRLIQRSSSLPAAIRASPPIASAGQPRQALEDAVRAASRRSARTVVRGHPVDPEGPRLHRRPGARHRDLSARSIPTLRSSSRKRCGSTPAMYSRGSRAIADRS